MPEICQHLRTKASYVPAERSPLYLTKTSPTAQYWCLKTMMVVGPDNDFVCPEDCKPDRVCFVLGVQT